MIKCWFHINTLKSYIVRNIFIHSVFMMINITIAFYALLYMLFSIGIFLPSALFIKMASLTAAHFHCISNVCSCTYWAAIKIYKARRLFEKVFLNSVRLVACGIIWIRCRRRRFSISFFLFIHFSFDIFRYDNVWRTSRQANTPTHSHDNNKHWDTHTFTRSHGVYVKWKEKKTSSSALWW